MRISQLRRQLAGATRTAPRLAARLATLPTRVRERVALIAVLALSSVLEFWHLDQLGTSNSFYAAAVLSMIQNWRAFFFNSLDSAGFVSIDKPPLGFWIQALSARLLGFSGFNILVPEALATVGSVALVYHLVKRAFGGVAGLLAALIMAMVPVSVMIGRNNTIDSLLVFVLLLAAWTCLWATERGSAVWLIATGAIVGLGFEIKMLEAYLIVPALGLVYLLGAPLSRRARLVHLAAATTVMLVVSFAWPLAVDLTPANARPFVDSTQDNSAISLALGYNGLERLFGQNREVSQFLAGLGIHVPSSMSTSSNAAIGDFSGLFSNGPAGPFRLFDRQLGGQASWLLPLSLVGLAFGIWQAVKDRAITRQSQAAIAFGTWLITAGAFFSVANFFHSYYLVTIAPPIAALAASGLWSAWRAYRDGSRLAWLLPAVLVGTALVQAQILSDYPAWSVWLTPLAVGGAGVAAAAIAYGLIRQRQRRSTHIDHLAAQMATTLAMTALLVAPVTWSAYSSQFDSNIGLPVAGPRAAGERGAFAWPDGGARPGVAPDGMPPGPRGGPDAAVSDALIGYLQQNQGAATYLVATQNSHTAASIILATNEPVMSLGGFTGSDPILTVDEFAALVDAGELRYVLLGGGGPGNRGFNSHITTWVQANGTPVPAASLGGSESQLYDLAGRAPT